ncbi:2-amino-4-hydroxy-6-hydroxymethyldihydropteridine diphosphokinase [Williamsia sp. 1138]|uniref:2-amino-4-hydroxy-6- hydroxymethyldihydropteridine diphosphokinase n=1 Tax=Williamsia sp. 1138 TaxID=1903117 RepID=UPI000A11B2C2|nr:2-amino-4-hydroxy-6-hydroxymethyldihydropteridine diphosphokinase [Williamsia sp. 1138]OZG28074.1 2-amino-4-hydroxy-6-hydroxymethyldihydropteridine diphosphokinase [Williamsia sp. 1138]
MSRAVLSIGSNIGDRLTHLQSVCDGLGTAVVAASGVYSTPPWGGVEQQDFLNAVLIVDDADRDAGQWLKAGQELEQQADRKRVQRWGPRTLDVDVISVPHDDGEVISDDPVLTLPHPRAAERAFVLVPWLDADADAALWHAGARVPVTKLLAALPTSEREGVTRTDDRLVITGSEPR